MKSMKQSDIDDMKWDIGVKTGQDPCGSFDFCKHCNKNEQRPCEKAKKRFNDCQRKREKRQQSKKTIGGLNFRATVVDTNN